MDAKKFIDAVSELSETKGLSRDAIIFALEEALKRAYIKYLGGGDDAVVTCSIDEEKGKIELAQIKKVVEEDDIEDDYLQISVEEANKGLKKAKYKAGDDCVISCSVEDLSKVTALAVKNNLRQRLAEAERTMLYEIYKDHIGEMMTGVVEKAEDRSITIKIDRTTIELTRKELIGDEIFRAGDPIKVYIQEVKAAEATDGKASRGPQIQATRSSEGFLKRLFEEEIHEIYDGTVVIKAIARSAGVRSKVAVASLTEDVDATGACIGQGGNRIQKIVAQLGNGKNKEKIDVINYSPNIGMFLVEAVRPAVALGLNVEEDEKFAEILIEDGSYPLALGKYKSNLSLAKKLTGYEIDFVEKSKAEQLGLRFTSIDEWKARAEEEKKEAERLAYLNKRQEEAVKAEAKRRADEEARLAEAEEAEEAAEEVEEAMPEVIINTPAAKPVPPKADVRPEEFPAAAANPAAAALAAEKAAKEAREAAKAAEAQPTSVTTTTTLDALEKELEEAKEKKTKSGAKTKRPRKITEEEVSHEPAVKPVVPTVPVYTEEELSAIESEEAAYEDADYDAEYEDYSEYDDYDDGDR